jgi:potassium efflux system protein
VLRRNLWLLAPAVFPLAIAIGALEQHGDDAWLGSLGRLVLLPLLGLMTVFLWRVLHPVTGVLGGSTERTLVVRFRRLWFVLVVGTMAALFVMTVLGYEYTVIQLARSMIYTVAIVLAGAVTHALILHKLLLERRRLSIQQARERLAAARAAREAAEAGEEGDEDEEEEQFALDPSSIAEQTQTLVRAAAVLTVLLACLQVWGEVLPALGALRQVELWTDESVEPPIQITLVDLLKSLLIVLITALAARNIPGLLELLVLRRLHVQAGERHATTTLARYVLVVIGTVMAFSTIGLGWSKVQWLIAAVSLGLGFGLQEIFANFVSGLILLFERPVRVGDWVLVGDWLGKVTRIKIRATTVRDLDNKELVVPNREFVTGRFVNWTLTDSLVRLRLPVGVAYGSDTQKAKQLLVQAARETSLAVETPAPRALFLGFGESSLELELRVFVEDYQEHAPLLDDLHTRVDRLFREHGIEIAFPQRDLHLRTAKPLVEFIDRRDAAVHAPPP